MRKKVLAIILAVAGLAGGLSAATYNVKEYGAKGDGKTDDTAAIQKVIGILNKNKTGEIYFPVGIYSVRETLKITEACGISVRGENGTPWKHKLGGITLHTSALVWNGEENGTLFNIDGVANVTIKNINFCGRNGKDGKRAGILMLMNSHRGWGSMMYQFDNVHFYDASVGIQNGSPGKPNLCNSDYCLTYTTFTRLDKGMYTVNSQGVDFLFNYVFGLGVKTVFDFPAGGNIEVNDIQLTDCDLLLNINGGGKCVATYLFSNARIESSNGGKKHRFQALKTKPSDTVNVKFVGYCDAQWDWVSNTTPDRVKPLCEIGPRTFVTFENSIFASPLAEINGNVKYDANLIVRDSIFWRMSAADSVKANANGNFRLENNVDGAMKPFPDTVKWPVSEKVILKKSSEHKADWSKKQ